MSILVAVASLTNFSNVLYFFYKVESGPNFMPLLHFSGDLGTVFSKTEFSEDVRKKKAHNEKSLSCFLLPEKVII